MNFYFYEFMNYEYIFNYFNMYNYSKYLKYYLFHFINKK